MRPRIERRRSVPFAASPFAASTLSSRPLLPTPLYILPSPQSSSLPPLCCRQRLKEAAAKGALGEKAASATAEPAAEPMGHHVWEREGQQRAGPEGAPRHPQEGAKPGCDDEWPNACEPE